MSEPRNFLSDLHFKLLSGNRDLAAAYLAGCPIEYSLFRVDDGYVMTARTRDKIAVVETQGRTTVYVRKENP